MDGHHRPVYARVEMPETKDTTEYIPCQRELFDIPQDFAYLNCGTMAPHTKRQFDVGCKDLSRRLRPWSITAETLLEEPEPLRNAFARLINAHADDIAVVAATSYGMATAAQNLPVATGQKIILLEDQFPSNFHIWHRLADDVGATCVIVPRPADGDWTSSVLEAIDSSVAVAALPPLHWLDGCLLDLQAIGDAVHAVGGALAVDATQAAGAIPLDVRQIKPDFLVASCYKWLLGPYGLALMYVAPKYQAKAKPLEQSWVHGPLDLRKLMTHPLEHVHGARQFDVGERSHLASISIATMGIESLIRWNPQAIQETIGLLTDKIVKALEHTGFRAPPAQYRSKHYLCLRHENGMPSELLERLNDANVSVSLYLDTLRVTPHIYNNEADIARLTDVLTRL